MCCEVQLSELLKCFINNLNNIYGSALFGCAAPLTVFSFNSPPPPAFFCPPLMECFPSFRYRARTIRLAHFRFQRYRSFALTKLKRQAERSSCPDFLGSMDYQAIGRRSAAKTWNFFSLSPRSDLRNNWISILIKPCKVLQPATSSDLWSRISI